jgi:hypothetical protein
LDSRIEGIRNEKIVSLAETMEKEIERKIEILKKYPELTNL